MTIISAANLVGFLLPPKNVCWSCFINNDTLCNGFLNFFTELVEGFVGHGKRVIIKLTHSSDHKITGVIVRRDGLLVGGNSKQPRQAVKKKLTDADI